MDLHTFCATENTGFENTKRRMRRSRGDSQTLRISDTVFGENVPSAIP